MNPFSINPLLAIAVAAALALGSFGAGWRTCMWYRDSEQLEAQEKQQQKADQNAAVADTAAVGHEGDKVRIQKVFVPITETVERIIEKPIYRNICFDADGLRELATATGAPQATPGQPAPALPGPSAPE